MNVALLQYMPGDKNNGGNRMRLRILLPPPYYTKRFSIIRGSENLK